MGDLMGGKFEKVLGLGLGLGGGGGVGWVCWILVCFGVLGKGRCCVQKGFVVKQTSRFWNWLRFVVKPGGDV